MYTDFPKKVGRKLKRESSKATKLLCAYLVSNVAEFVPKQPRLVLFGTRRTRTYQGNSRYVYEYLLDGEYDVDPIWVTHSKNIYRRLSSEGKPVAYIYSLTGVYLLIRASAAVITHGRWDIAFHPEAVPGSLVVVHSGHGNGVMHSKHHSPEEVRAAQQAISDKCDKWITTSPFVRDIRLRRLSLNDNLERAREQIGVDWVSTGYPRNDLVLDPPEERIKQWESFIGDASPEAVILYAPTIHYDASGNITAPKFFPFDDCELAELGAFLHDNDVFVLIRPHPEDVNRMEDNHSESYAVLRERIAELLECSQNVRLATQDEIGDTSTLLPFTDILMTDYSSIYHHFLLLDRPIFFAPYDFDTYRQHRGFAYDYYEHMPGPEITSFEQFTEEVDAFLSGDTYHEERRTALRERIHTHTDGNSRGRVVELLCEILNHCT